VTPVVSDREMLRAYAETIEQLRRVIEAQVERLDYLEARHANEFNLLSRATDALGSPSWKDKADLIVELRKAIELK
jgi:hypothetical protein